MNFLQDLFSDSSKISHKRVIAIGSFLALLIMVGLKAFNMPIDNTLIYTFAGMTGAYSTMSLVDKKINNEKNTTSNNDTISAV